MELMAEGQWKRWDAVARLGAGKLTLQEAARVLRLSVRQVRRIRRAVERAGRAGLCHGNAGQVPVNKLRAAVRTRILRLRRTKYRDFNDAHFTEKLAEEQPPLRISVRTVRRVLRAGGVPAVRRRPPKHRRRRDRKAQAGLMLLGDGSRHDSELRLAGARTSAEANAVLERYRPVHNRRFAIPPQDTTPAWRPLRRGVDLDRVCSFRYEATVLNDNTIHLAGMVLDIPPGPRGRSYRDKRVEVRQLLDRSWRVYLGDGVIATGPATAHGELRAQRRRKHGRGAPSMAPLPPRLIEAAL